VKVTPDQRPNRAARIRRAGNLTRTREESKVKRELEGAEAAETRLFRFFEPVQNLQHPIELAVDFTHLPVEDVSPRVNHQKSIPYRE
jgi:hypothetical protein